MGRIRELIDRLTGRAGNAESDVQADPARADAREPGGTYVGRRAGDDDFSGEAGSDRRSAT